MLPTDESSPEDSATGLPIFRTWRALYAFVLAAFALMLALLIALTLAYS